MAPEEEEALPSRINRGYPRDLLQRFADNSAAGKAAADGGDVGEIELELSLGGCYGAELKGTRLARASSMTLSVFPGERIDFPVVTTPLTRTYSLPTETEEERRKRKEMECLKRMEAKRKRSEKRAAAINNNRKEDNLLEEDLVNKVANGVVFPAEMAKLAAGTGGRGGARPASQRSIGSQGSSSSGVSDFESRPVQGNLTKLHLLLWCLFCSMLIAFFIFIV